MEAATDFETKGFVTDVQRETTCCYAVQDKVWVNDPDGTPWQIYTVLADETISQKAPGCCARESASESTCC